MVRVEPGWASGSVHLRILGRPALDGRAVGIRALPAGRHDISEVQWFGDRDSWRPGRRNRNPVFKD